MQLNKELQLFIRDILQCPQCGGENTFVVSATKVDLNGITRDFTRFYCQTDGLSAEFNFDEAIKNTIVSNKFTKVNVVCNDVSLGEFDKFEFKLVSANIVENPTIPLFKLDEKKGLVEEFLSLNDDEKYINLTDIHELFKDSEDPSKVYIILKEENLLTDTNNINFN